MAQVYTFQILLPEPIQQELREWTKKTPGATLPGGGAHITVLSSFEPLHGLAPVQEATAEVCAQFQPFSICLSRVISGTHWQRTHLNGVFLLGNGRAKGIRQLVKLHSGLKRALAPFKRDLQPQISSRRYKPHVSLTWGIPAMEAVRLARAARSSRLQIEFTVERIWLLEFTPDSSMPQAIQSEQAFEFGAG